MIEQEVSKEPEQDKLYKANFTNTDEKERKEFKNSKCILGISVGQKYHENGKFHASVRLVNKHFSYCNILVADTLQRYTMNIEQQDIDEKEIYILSKKAGDAWIERNMKYISELTIPYVVSRWDEWLADDRYQYYSKQVSELYNNDAVYKDAVETIARDFLLKRDSSNIKNQKLAFDLCLKYLLEESAVACLWVECGHKFDVYPSGANLVMIMAVHKLVPKEISAGSKSLQFKTKKIHNKAINKLKAEEYKDIATNYILNHAPGHIYWKNLEGVILGCNTEQAKYFGFDNPNDMIGKTNADLLGKEAAAYVSDIDTQVIITGQEYVIEERINGGQYFLSKKTPLRDDHNRVVGILGTSINITEQKRLEANLEKTVEELAKALDSKESFIKNMNHEVRIPMQLILNGSQLLKDNFYAFSDEEKLYFLDGMIKATNRLNDLVTNLFDMSKFNEGKFTLNHKTEDLLVLFEEVIQEFSLMYKNKITCEILLNDVTHVICDKIRIQQVLRNLLMNSIKYGGESTPIFASLLIHDEEGIQYIKCSIKDEGIGIPKEEKDNLFKPFVGSSITRDVSGSIGLGLTISKEIIQSHNGKIWIDDIKEDETGARISFIIPVEQFLEEKKCSLLL